MNLAVTKRPNTCTCFSVDDFPLHIISMFRDIEGNAALCSIVNTICLLGSITYFLSLKNLPIHCV